MNVYEKMRDALEFADKELRKATEDDRFGDDLVYLVGCMRTVAEVCRAALAAPRRNCDIGTAEELERRFYEFCESRDCGRDCPVFKANCVFSWAQMPYNESEVKK